MQRFEDGGQFDWRKHLAVHPACGEFPRLSDVELKELADDILANGLRNNIVVWAQPDEKYEALLDGQNRLDALTLLGLLCVDRDGCLATNKRWIGTAWVTDGRPERLRRTHLEGGDPYALAASFNIRRRHLNVEQRQELLIRLIARQPERSDRQIAKTVGVDHKTIGVARAKGEDVGRIPHIETHTDSKGRKQPAKKAKKAKKANKAKPIKANTTANAAIKESAKPKPAVSPPDTALFYFTARVLDLVQRISKHDAGRFAATGVKANDLAKLGKFFTELALLKDTEVRR